MTQDMTAALAPSHNWDLERLYGGGPAGPAISTLFEQTEAKLRELLPTLKELPVLGTSDDAAARWAEALLMLERLDDAVSEIWAFAECSLAAHAEDAAARRLTARTAQLSSLRAEADVPVWSKLAAAEAAAFEAFVSRPDVAHMRLVLIEERERAEVSMAPELEALHVQLAKDGFHAWYRLYDQVTGALRIHVDRGQGVEALSIEQARNLLESRDQALREHVAEATETAWASQADTLAAILSHINGYRQTLYTRRGVDELELPLRQNRLSRETLDAMLAAIADFRPTMKRYLEAKARCLGLEKLRWFDIDVPLGLEAAGVPYEAAQTFIAEEFSAFSSRLGKFARRAFRGSWIEAEDRSGKLHGGFCTGFPLHTESRIFMTFGQTAGSVQTLAHELGHAYHTEVMWDLPGWQRDYTSSLAETASTFAESIVREAAFRSAASDDVRLSMLDRKLADAAAFVLNIPARIRFERAMFRERLDGELPAQRLSELVVEAFSEAYADGLAAYERYFWASKLHFYLTDIPFYNFPYSFGYLFSQGLFARALEEGASFAARYDQVLRLTGSHSCEDVAMKALGVDLRQPEFWQSALSIVGRDVEAFLALADGIRH